MNTLVKNWCLLVAALATSLTAEAQTTINWFTLDAAGGAQSSPAYVINSTAGQNDTGNSATTSANYRIIPGFWALENLGPDTGLPTLSITRNALNVVLAWPSPSTGFVLQQADSLDTLPVPWANTPGVFTDNGFIKSITIPANVAKRFYRLQRP